MDELVSMMVGRKIGDLYGRKEKKSGRVALETVGLTGLRFRNINVKVHEGEIVGLGGLVGAGRTELAKAIYGYDRVIGGKIFVYGKEMQKHSPKESVAAGIGFLPEDRKTEGLIQSHSIRMNILQASMWKYFKGGIVNHKVENEQAEKYRRELRIASPDITRSVSALS